MSDLITLLLIVAWPSIGVAAYAVTGNFNEKDWDLMPAMMAWGLFMSLLYGPVGAIGLLLGSYITPRRKP